ncbi:MAG: hypothetical protein ACOYY3_18945 [Chloroflexota bacterium]
MGKSLFVALLLALLLTSCSGWTIEIPEIPSPFPSPTPLVFTPTPRLVTPTLSSTPEIGSPTAIVPATATETPTLAVADTDTPTPTPTPGSFSVEVLGCNTSLDIRHGMGEVTNAYVLLRNTTGAGLTNVCATLFALDEGRPHPDKTVCVPLLESGFQVSLKLTVDSTYQEETPIQVDVTVEGVLLAREGEPSCRDLGLFGPPTGSILTPVPVP